MFLQIGPNREDFKAFQILKILILRIILRKLQNSEKNSKNKTILRIRILVNTGPDYLEIPLLEGQIIGVGLYFNSQK